MSFVLDASTALALVLGEATGGDVARIQEVMRTAPVQVPSIWPLEMANVLLTQARRNRIGWEACAEGLSMIADLSVLVDPLDVAQACGPVAVIARAHDLTAYDAAYLELALRLELPLATLDERLARAAVAAGARVF